MLNNNFNLQEHIDIFVILGLYSQGQQSFDKPKYRPTIYFWNLKIKLIDINKINITIS